MNIELYIANRLCDLEKSDLSIRLKRQFINPSELNTKDAQKSYTISLPSTPTNDEIFRYSNVEETEGKFSIYPDARLYVNNILILEGKFRLTEITRDSYKGNLGVPAPLTAKDVFGEMKMNEAGEWLVEDFTGLESISEYNKKTNPKCIFPYALYSTLPYNLDNTNNLGQSPDKLEITDFPPSTNCIQLLKKLFEHTNYKLSGNALDDELLKNLYVSYRNPAEYQMPFNYKKVVLEGKWSNFYSPGRAERQCKVLPHPYAKRYEDTKGKDKDHQDHNFIACNLFQADNFTYRIIEDSSKQVKIISNNKIEYKVPKNGLYKIKLDSHFSFRQNEISTITTEDRDGAKNNIVDYKKYKNDYKRDLKNVSLELKLVRSENESFDLEKATMDNYFIDFNKDYRERNYPDPNLLPHGTNTHFIDKSKNPYLISGFTWGRPTHDNYHSDKITITENQETDNFHYFQIPEYVNKNQPMDEACNIIAPLYSEDSFSEGYPKTTISAIYSPGYVKNENEEKAKYKVDLINANNRVIANNRALSGEGELSQIMWLNAGENITILTVMDRARDIDWIHHDIYFTLEIEPFSSNQSWLTDKMDATTSSSKEPIDFLTPVDFLLDSMNLIKFQPSEIKIDDWISNFCKAFNLELLHTGKNQFELNIKNHNGLNKATSKVIDLDKKANVWHATNENMSLPSSYDLGFTINTSEQGYSKSFNKKEIEDGGGKFPTGSNEPKTIKQTSNFSYCWYETLPKAGKQVPNLTEKEVWEPGKSEKEANAKKFFNSAQRFWYHTNNTQEVKLYGNTPVDLALVSNTYKGDKTLELNYEDKPNSIMRSYFMLLTNERNYTSVECYLSPEEYSDLGNSYIKFNGDLYIVAEADGYDPMGKSKTKLKLIKKM